VNGPEDPRHGKAADEYGRHSRAHAQGPVAGDLLRRVLRSGQSIRLAWRADSPTDAEADEFPTAELPILHQESAPSLVAPKQPGSDVVGSQAGTEPKSATRGWDWFPTKLQWHTLTPL
jgi:hypothetical protein